MPPHPLTILSEQETNIARNVIVAAYPGKVIDFREIYLLEPPKAQLKEYLALEHSARLSPTSPRPPRLALCQYDVVGPDRVPEYHESVVDVESRRRVKHQVVGKPHHASLSMCVAPIALGAKAQLVLMEKQEGIRHPRRALQDLPAISASSLRFRPSRRIRSRH